MNNYQVTWHSAESVLPEDRSFVCRQVYVWIVTNDNKVVIVSKDGKQWQFPGGKPETSESHIQTAVREVFEETGLDISIRQHDLQFIGYYSVLEIGPDSTPYTQLRYMLKIPVNSAALRLDSAREDTVQDRHDVIKHVRAVAIDEVLELIPWLGLSPEFQAVQPLLV